MFTKLVLAFVAASDKAIVPETNFSLQALNSVKRLSRIASDLRRTDSNSFECHHLLKTPYFDSVKVPEVLNQNPE